MNKKNRNKKSKKEIGNTLIEIESDENFAYIIGYTSGGAPFGVTHEEMEEEEIENNKSENKK